jgi:hypothetical protein
MPSNLPLQRTNGSVAALPLPPAAERQYRWTDMRVSELQPYLTAGDEALQPAGFRRSARSQEWKKVCASTDLLWIHLNAGHAVLNPSLGVIFRDVAKLLPGSVSGNLSTARLLGDLFTPPRDYSLDTAPEDLARDVISHGLVELDRLRDREAVVRALQSEVPDSWPTMYSDRIRLLPLLLAAAGRTSEALDAVRAFGLEAPMRDLLLPDYASFARAFESRFAV